MNITFEAVREIICEQMGVDHERVTPESNLVSDLGADSLDSIELVMAFEEAYEIQIPDEAVDNLRTVQDAVDYLQAHVKGAA